MKKIINYMIILVFFLISIDIHARPYRNLGKDFLDSKKTAYQVEKQNRKSKLNIRKETPSISKKKIPISDSTNYNLVAFLLFSMLLFEDINNNYSLNYQQNTNIKSNDPFSLLPDNDMDYCSVNRTLYSISKKKHSDLHQLKDRLTFVNNECTFDSLIKNPKYNNIPVITKERSIKRFIPNYKKIIGADIAHENGYQGKDVIVMVIDTGIDKRSLLNTEHVHLAYNDTLLYENDKFIEHDHGTHISGVIQTIAPQSSIISVEIDESNCFNDFHYARQNVNYLKTIGKKLDVINYSIGLNSMNDQKLIDTFKMLTDNDVVIFIALGNDWHHVDDNLYYKELIDFVNHEEFRGLVRVVGNLEYFTNERAEAFHYSSNRCSEDLDCKYLIVAPGSNICSTLPNNKVGLKTGTSMATPMLVGVYSLLRSAYPDKSAKELLNLIDESARKINLDGEILGHEYGVGVIDIKNAFALAMEKNWHLSKSWFEKIINFIF